MEAVLWNLLDGPVDSLLNTPLHLSMQFSCEAITKWLSQHGANPLLQNQRGRHGYSVVNRVQQLEPSKMGPAAGVGFAFGGSAA
jgi:ankyrin repeat protein